MLTEEQLRRARLVRALPGCSECLQVGKVYEVHKETYPTEVWYYVRCIRGRHYLVPLDEPDHDFEVVKPEEEETEK